jgi:hypothetical protein
MSARSVPHQRKTFTTYRWRTYNRWQFALNPMVSSNDMTYETWLAYLQKSIIYIYMIYIITYPSSGARALNAARIVLHTLRERIHVLRKRPQDIPRSPHPRCAVVTSHTIDTQHLLHDRDCPQASLVLRGRIRDSHHPAKGNLHSYLFVGVS